MGDYFQDTLRLYLKSDSAFRYLWIYARKDWIIVDEGDVGQMRDHQVFPVGDRAKINALIQERRDAGYAEIDESQMTYHDIVFGISGSFANEQEMDQRNLIWDELDAFLAVTGQGWTDGASSGIGTMEIGVVTVSDKILKDTIPVWLTENGFGELRDIVDYGAYQ